MKKQLFILSFLLLAIGLAAQELPLDPQVRRGQLSNGLTYYIQKNNYPENRAVFYLAQEVGSMQEEDNQSGLAHFLEHMAFASTKNFPNKVIDFLEKGGMKMGQNINAYTSYDQTVYYLSDIPTDRPGLIDTCLLIVHDWSGFISLNDKDIDKERGVIKEEWRGRQGAYSRIFDKEVPVMFEGSKYANRNVIGKMEVVENFKYQELKDYYHKWYRPDLQTVIIVGNIDVDKIETELKKLYQDIPKPVNPAKRIYYPVKDNTAPIVSITTDPEATTTSLSYYIKHDIYQGSKNTLEKMKQNYAQGMFSSMLYARLQEIGQSPDAPYTYAGGNYGSYYMAKTKDAWTSRATVKEGKIKEALEIIAREQERIRRYGFTDAEIERAKANLLNNLENRYNNRNKQMTGNIASSILGMVQSKGYLPGIEYEYEVMKKEIPLFGNDLFKQMAEAYFTANNQVITVSGPEKEGLTYPGKQELLDVITRVQKEDITPYVETVSNEPLVSNLPAPGKIIKEETGGKYDETVWTLSNGIKVILKKTDFHADQIQLSAIGYGGKFQFDADEKFNYQDLSYLPIFGGVGSFNAIDLKKKLAGKSVGMQPAIGNYTQGLRGNSNKKDVETMFQLAYLYLTSPHKDTKAFEAYIEEYKTYLLNQSKNPSVIFYDTLNVVTYGNQPRAKQIKTEDLGSINYDRMIELYKKCFSRPGEMTFILVGTLEENELKPLVEKYLACLPSGDKAPQVVQAADYLKNKGEIIKRFSQKMETPKAQVAINYTASMKHDENTTHDLAVLNNILQQAFFRAMRKDKSGVYGAGASMGIEKFPIISDNASLSVNFTTDPGRIDEMLEVARKELQSIVDNGPRPEEYAKAIESAVNDRTTWNKLNGFWVAVLECNYFYGEEENLDFEKRIRAVTPQKVQQMVKDVMATGNKIEVVMVP